MNYQTEINKKNITKSNTTVATYSPRQTGEKAVNSDWQERNISQLSFSERVEAIHAFASIGYLVWIKTATNGGKARLFVKRLTFND